jgi:hypothetical protein
MSDIIEEGSFSHEHSAHYDQKAAEMAEKLQKADAFMIYTYTKDDEPATGTCMIGSVPGTSCSEFLENGLNALYEMALDIAGKAGEVDDSETEG